MDQKKIFREFINARFLAFQNAKGERATVTEFADALSVRAESGEVINQVFQGDVSHWLHGTRIPGAAMLKILAKSKWVGPDVWKAAGYQFGPDLDPLEAQVLGFMRKMPPAMRQEFARMVESRAEAEQEKGEQSQLSFQGSQTQA